ncbi:MAG: hypothetical protein ACLQPD_35310 [Desulfomonilaceae bacterium]
MADIITNESVDTENFDIERRIDEFRKTIDYLLSAFEKGGVSRDRKGRYCKRTLEENYLLMHAYLVDAYESPDCMGGGLSDHLYDFYLDTYDMIDFFIAYKHEHGDELDPRNAMFALNLEAQEILALILAEKIEQWNSKTAAELKQIRDDLVIKLREDWERANTHYNVMFRQEERLERLPGSLGS